MVPLSFAVRYLSSNFKGHDSCIIQPLATPENLTHYPAAHASGAYGCGRYATEIDTICVLDELKNNKHNG